jgi:hypothetical protein
VLGIIKAVIHDSPTIIATKLQHGRARLLHRQTLCQIARLIDIRALEHRDVVRE